MQKGAKHRAAALVRRFPLFAEMMTLLYRQTRPRFTIGVVGVVLNEDLKVLVVEHVFHARNRWGLPGGWLDRNETPVEGVHRELREELGLEISVIAPILIGDSFGRRNHLDVAFLCKPHNDIQRLSGELLSYRWATPDSIPGKMMPIHREAVGAAYEFWNENIGHVRL